MQHKVLLPEFKFCNEKGSLVLLPNNCLTVPRDGDIFPNSAIFSNRAIFPNCAIFSNSAIFPNCAIFSNSAA